MLRRAGGAGRSPSSRRCRLVCACVCWYGEVKHEISGACTVHAVRAGSGFTRRDRMEGGVRDAAKGRPSCMGVHDLNEGETKSRPFHVHFRLV